MINVFELSPLHSAPESKTAMDAKTETKSLYPYFGMDGDGGSSSFAQFMMTETGEEQQDDELNLLSGWENILAQWLQTMGETDDEGALSPKLSNATVLENIDLLSLGQTEQGKGMQGYSDEVFEKVYQSIKHILLEQMNSKDKPLKIDQIESLLRKQGSEHPEWPSFLINHLKEDIQALTLSRNQAITQGENRVNLYELWRDMSDYNSRILKEMSSRTHQMTGEGEVEQRTSVAAFEKVYQSIKHILFEQMNSKDQALKIDEVVSMLRKQGLEHSEWPSFLINRLKEDIQKGHMNIQTSKGRQVEFPVHLPLSLLNQTGEGEETQDKMVPLRLENRAMPQETGQVDAGRTEKTIPTLRSQHLAEDMKGLFRFHLLRLPDEGTSQIRVRLHPEHLGHLDIRITSVEGRISAQLLTNNHIAQEVLEKQVHQLRFAIMQQGVQVDKIEISQQNQPNLSQSHAQHPNFSQQEDEKGGQPFLKQGNQDNHPSTTEDPYLEPEEVPEELLPEQLFYDMQDEQDSQSPAPFGLGSKINFAV